MKKEKEETMNDIEAPEDTPQEEPTISIKIAAVADGKHLDVDGALILFLQDGTVRWAPKEKPDA